MSALPRFVVLYAAMYAAYGVASPFLPAFVNSRGIAPEELGLVLGTGTAVRLISAPLAGRIGDLFEALRTVLVLCIALAAFTTLGFLPARGFWWFLAISALQAAALAKGTALVAHAAFPGAEEPEEALATARAAMAGPEAYASRQPSLPHLQRRPFALMVMCPSSPATSDAPW